MGEKIKTVDLVDLSEFKIWLPPERLEAGTNVLVQTPTSKNQNFHILLEIVRNEDDERYVGRVVGSEPPALIGTGKFITEADLGGIESGDLIYFKKCNVR